MTRALRHQLNALICAALAAHAIYWFASGQAATATNFRIGLVVAQALVGGFGAVWFLYRSRTTAGRRM
jgi:di/tricarboxylate transporter